MSAAWTKNHMIRELQWETGSWPLMSTAHCPALLTIFAVGVAQLPSCLLGTGGGLIGGGSGLLRPSRPRGALILSVVTPCSGAPFVSSDHSEVRPLLGQLVQFLRRREGGRPQRWSV